MAHVVEPSRTIFRNPKHIGCGRSNKVNCRDVLHLLSIGINMQVQGNTVLTEISNFEQGRNHVPTEVVVYQDFPVFLPACLAVDRVIEVQHSLQSLCHGAMEMLLEEHELSIFVEQYLCVSFLSTKRLMWHIRRLSTL